MENPVRRQPDYNEQEPSAEKRKRDAERVATLLMQDYRSGAFVRCTLPLPDDTFGDCLAEYDMGRYLGDKAFRALVAERVNRQVRQHQQAKLASNASSLAYHVAHGFARAIERGLIPAKRHYTRSQLQSFIQGALGTEKVDGGGAFVDEVAVVHNIRNTQHGICECEAQVTTLL